MRTIEELPQMLKVSEVADSLRVSRMTIYRLVSDGVLRSAKVGGQVRIFTDSFEEYLSSAVQQK